MRPLWFMITVSAAAVICGCGTSEPGTAPTVSRPQVQLPVPTELTVEQRTTTTIPGSKERLSLTVDDVTGNQVMVSLSTVVAESPLPVRSMSPEDTAEFEFDGRRYMLTLRELDDALIGTDKATFHISVPCVALPSEQVKIEQLITAVAALEGATFIRNGAEHSAAEAAEHLQAKWDASGDEVATARGFVDQVGSQSSLTGDPYKIRMPDGVVVSARDFLNEQLARMAESQSDQATEPQ